MRAADMFRNVLLQRFLAWGALPLILIGALAAWFALDPGFRWDRHAPDLAVDLPQDEFGRRVRAYLLEHPEVIMEAASRFEDRQRAAQESEAEAILKSRAEEVFRDPDSP